MGRDAFRPAFFNTTVLISIHTPRVGRDLSASCENRVGRKISIHTPRMGRDLIKEKARGKASISIHTPRMGRDCADQRDGG